MCGMSVIEPIRRGTNIFCPVCGARMTKSGKRPYECMPCYIRSKNERKNGN